MIQPNCAVLLALLLGFVPVPAAQDKPDLEVEKRIVQYLKEHVKPGERVIVSDLYRDVFKSPEEQKVLDRLFNTFFKIPLFVAQYKASTGGSPSLADIARQFNFPVEGEADVILSIMESDPRVPKFITRDPKTGEITSVDVEKIKQDRRFGQILERTLTGWAGKDAPPFSIALFDGTTLVSDDLKGKNYLLYFWFSGCPPCVKIAPHLAELQRRYQGRNFTVVAVNADRFLELDTTDAERNAYIKKAGFTFPVGHLTKKMQQDYGAVTVYPTLFLVNSKGIIQKNYVNYQPLEALAKDIEETIQPAP
jgi:thiol-disulfide isomerase/thioredoxin